MHLTTWRKSCREAKDDLKNVLQKFEERNFDRQVRPSAEGG